ncbi:uncharacterized protein LOC111715519 [Eurytemora carolleeae]|uniref:uncharacterized protein LOC111715519 n=1 Tax=Eurytemora carolleeae TaxID=1294199 RepID=UPI000C7832F1|nr:uncharacterized protein LOC111715519 [Eurytemora carolleeae]|eukprot:XP_023346621.1 uncharacterized protein LOC111715519 [Eurytemora affinis]
MKKEADSLIDNVKELFPEIQESSAKDLDESEYEEGLPLVLNKFIRSLEAISRMPVKPQNIQECSNGLESIEKLKLASKAGFGILDKIGECTEKTPAHKPVWEQICLLKKVNTAFEDQSQKLISLLSRWRNLEKSEKEDDIDFQPLLGFLLVYSQIFAA